MLNNREQRILDDIEEHLRAEDPRFETRITAGSADAPYRGPSWNRIYVALVLLALAGMVVELSTILTLLALLVAAVVVVRGFLPNGWTGRRKFGKS